jgi:hypothetical protein
MTLIAPTDFYEVDAITSYPKPGTPVKQAVRADSLEAATELAKARVYRLEELVSVQPYTGRFAYCAYTHRNPGTHDGGGRNGGVPVDGLRPALGAAFLESKPDAEFDTYYCGCFGWD